MWGGVQLEDYKQNTDMLKEYLADEESKKCFDGIYRYFKTDDINHLVDICTTEDCYFIHEVIEHFKNQKINLIDAGSYKGELLNGIIKSGLQVQNWYCFELEENNYEHLKDNIKKTKLPENMNCICENCGLWNEKKECAVIGTGTASKASEELIDGNSCQMETIDNYFRNIPVDMIKMDIEGAEMKALQGGRNVILRDRPLLAISIYHYIKDYYRIMKFLLESTKGIGYKYYIRQHALIYGETVLYAIPIK